MSLTYVISDLHGRLDLLNVALDKILMNAPGTVVFTGDYIDRGPDSAGVVQRIMDGPKDGWRWVPIRGNHEDMMLECVRGTADLGWWVGNGGAATLASYGGEPFAAHLDWCDALPRLWSDEHRVYVHAGMSKQYDMAEQPEEITQWYRYPTGADVGYRGKHVVHGHTPNRNGPELFSQRTNLDTYAVGTGRLVVGVFDDNKPGGPVSLIEVKA